MSLLSRLHVLVKFTAWINSAGALEGDTTRTKEVDEVTTDIRSFTNKKFAGDNTGKGAKSYKIKAAEAYINLDCRFSLPSLKSKIETKPGQ